MIFQRSVVLLSDSPCTLEEFRHMERKKVSHNDITSTGQRLVEGVSDIIGSHEDMFIGCLHQKLSKCALI